MARISFDDLNCLPDLISIDSFEFIIPRLPGAGFGRDFSMKCHSVTLPGFSNEVVKTDLWGQTRHDRGRFNSTYQINATYYEDITFGTYNQLWNWHNFTVDQETGESSSDKSTYASNCTMIVYDTVGNPAINLSIYNLFPQTVQQIQLSGNSSAACEVSVDFSFDFIELDYGPLSTIGDVLGFKSLTPIGNMFINNLRSYGESVVNNITNSIADSVSPNIGGLGGIDATNGLLNRLF